MLERYDASGCDAPPFRSGQRPLRVNRHPAEWPPVRAAPTEYERTQAFKAAQTALLDGDQGAPTSHCRSLAAWPAEEV